MVISMESEDKLDKMRKYVKKQQLIGDNFSEFEQVGKYCSIISMRKGNSTRWLNDNISLVVPSFVDLIPGREFSSSSNITSLTFEERYEILQINERAFGDCYGIRDLDFSKCTNLVVIRERAFKDCYKLSRVEFSSKENSIMEYAFHDTNIEKLIIKCDKLAIDKYAFANCHKLREINIEANQLKIKDDAFFNCDNICIKSITGGHYHET